MRRRLLTASLALLIGVAAAWSLGTASVSARGQKLLDSITVVATKSAGVQTSVSLKAGTAYTLDIGGTVSAAGNTYDAFYCISGSSGGNACPTRTAPLMVSTAGASSYPKPDQAVDAFQTPSPNAGCTGETECAGGVQYRPDHHYTVTFYPPVTGKVTFGTDPQLKLHQAFFTSGSFAIKIYEAATSSGGATPKAKARVISVSGEVSVRRGSGPWMPVTAGTALERGDEVATGVDSHMVLAFEDGSTMKLDELTQVLASTLLFSATQRKDVALELAVGAIKAAVHHEDTLDTSFRIRQATASAGVRGTVFSDFYDKPDKAAVIAANVDSVTVTPTRPGAKAVVVPPGKEVEVTASGVSPLAPIGKANPHGGIDRARAFALATAAVDRATRGCGLTERAGAIGLVSIKPGGAGWIVALTAAGKASGVSTWSVGGAKATPANALARKLAARCASASSGADPSGSWQPINSSTGPAWVLHLNGATLAGSWSGSGAHAALRGTFTCARTGAGTYSGTFSVTENATHVTGTATVKLIGSDRLEITLTASGGTPSTITFRRVG